MQGVQIAYSEDLFDREEGGPEHFHNGLEIDYFTSADVKMFTKNISYDIHDGDLMLLEEKCIHRMIYPAGRQYSRYVINMDRSFIEPVLEFYGIGSVTEKLFDAVNRKISVSVRRRPQISELFDSLYQLYQKEHLTRADEAMFKSMMVILMCTVVKLPRSPVQSNDNPAENMISAVIAYIEENFAENITLDKISEEMHISKYYICHSFKKWTGFSITEYLQYCRVMSAQKILLEDRKKNITDICFQCGFSNIQHFYRVFRKLSGKTPMEFRKTGHLARAGEYPQKTDRSAKAFDPNELG